VTSPADEDEPTAIVDPEVRRRRRQRPAVAALIVVLLYLVGSNIWTQVTADEAQVTAEQATEEKKEAEKAAKEAVNPVDQLCAEGGVIAAELQKRGACEKAREVLDEPSPPSTDSGPSREDIADAVEDYLSVNPPPAGRPPTVGEVTSAVAEYLRANPPQPGRPPTPTEIATAVADYLQANPPPPGADGVDGEDAPPPTAEQIAAAVNEWLQANPPPAGPPGPPGPVCPEGYELREVVAVAPDGGTYTDALQCVRPASYQPPDSDPPLGGLIPGG